MAAATRLAVIAGMPPPKPCALCGMISMPLYKPQRLDVAFGGIGVQAIRERLERAGVQHLVALSVAANERP